MNVIIIILLLALCIHFIPSFVFLMTGAAALAVFAILLAALVAIIRG